MYKKLGLKIFIKKYINHQQPTRFRHSTGSPSYKKTQTGNGHSGLQWVTPLSIAFKRCIFFKNDIEEIKKRSGGSPISLSLIEDRHSVKETRQQKERGCRAKGS